MTCIYCQAVVDCPAYPNTCLSCTAGFMAPMTDNVIERRIQIERDTHGDAVADRLRDAIAERRK